MESVGIFSGGFPYSLNIFRRQLKREEPVADEAAVKKEILLIEDDPVLGRSLAVVLELEGFEDSRFNAGLMAV